MDLENIATEDYGITFSEKKKKRKPLNQENQFVSV